MKLDNVRWVFRPSILDGLGEALNQRINIQNKHFNRIRERPVIYRSKPRQIGWTSTTLM